MIGIIIVTHQRLAEEFRAALQHVHGPLEAVETVCIFPDDRENEARKRISEAVKRVDGGKGVVIMTDLFGGTPSNLALAIATDSNLEVVAGVNLPMLVKLAAVRDAMPLADAVKEACKAGKGYIITASQYFSEKQDKSN